MELVEDGGGEQESLLLLAHEPAHRLGVKWRGMISHSDAQCPGQFLNRLPDPGWIRG